MAAMPIDHAREEALIALDRARRDALVAEVMAENRPRLLATASVVAAAMQNAGPSICLGTLARAS